MFENMLQNIVINHKTWSQEGIDPQSMNNPSPNQYKQVMICWCNLESKIAHRKSLKNPNKIICSTQCRENGLVKRSVHRKRGGHGGARDVTDAHGLERMVLTMDVYF